MNRLQGKVAIITGAARGQGEATARLFHREGARVVLVDMLAEQGAALAAELGENARFIAADIADESGWKKVVALATEAFGAVHVLVNNAAITDHHGIMALDRARIERVLAVNLIAPMLAMQAVIPAMIAGGGGSIVNISSVNGLRGNAGMAAYDASKWGLRGVSKSVSTEYAGKGVRVNTIHPGAIRTPMLDPTGDLDGNTLARMLRIPIGRVAEADEVATASLFLASDEASYITGAELAVDGGWTAGMMVPEEIDTNTQVSG
ncbi:MAG: hypothetical protein RIS94_189 [Pseudomonadota bacterium]|jgi:3alpha(or 20beta)-hydroxysteroid dehydrogenase